MFRNFNLNVTVRVLVTGITISLLVIMFHSGYYATSIVLAVVVMYQLYSLLYYVNKTNRDLSRFLSGIENADFSQTFTSENLGASFDELAGSFSRVVDRFQAIRAEKEENFQYLQTVVRHVGTGLIAFEADGRIRLFNNAAKRVLGLPVVHKLEDLRGISERLTDQLLELKPGQRALVKVVQDGDLKQLALQGTQVTLRGTVMMLVSLQDIQSELEEKEMESWQKLIRVLTHEIMNSITPIGSLSATASDMLTGSRGSPPDEESLRDIRDALETISRRSEHLQRFVTAYRNLTRIPKPNFETVQLSIMLENVTNLLTSDRNRCGTEIHYEVVPSHLTLTADHAMIEQVLINLGLNACQAMGARTDGRVTFRAAMQHRGNVQIEVEDNGPGIDEDAMDKIFIPFFTTKREGSGIGLSLSRQIMRLHKGSITARSIPGQQTVFTLRF